MLKPMPNNPRLLSGSLPDQPALTAFFKRLKRHPGPVVLDGDPRRVVVGAWDGDGDIGVLHRVALASRVEEPVDGVVDELGEAAPLVEVDLAQHLQDPGVGGQV